MPENKHPLSSAQKEILLDQILHPGIPLYNIGGYIRIDGPADPVVFERAVRRIVAENDALRIILHKGDPLPVQEFPEYSDIKVDFHDFSEKENPHEYAVEWMNREFVKPFRLYGEILFRYALVKASEDCCYWLIKNHHLIADGWSVSLIGQRVAAAYNYLIKAEHRNEQKEYSYLDYIRDDLQYLGSEKFTRHGQYWLEKFSTIPEPLTARRYAGKYRGQAVPGKVSVLRLDREFYNRLSGFAKQNKVTVFHMFLGAVYCYFFRTTGNEDFVVEIPTLNRGTADFKKTIGLFAGVFPARFSFGGDISFAELVKSIALELRKDYRNQRFPWERSTGDSEFTGTDGSILLIFLSLMKSTTIIYFSTEAQLKL